MKTQYQSTKNPECEQYFCDSHKQNVLSSVFIPMCNASRQGMILHTSGGKGKVRHHRGRNPSDKQVAKQFGPTFKQEYSGTLATGQTVRESNLGGGEIFCTPPDRPWGPPILVYNGYRVSCPEVKWPERDVNNPPLCNAKVKERVELERLSLVRSCLQFTFCILSLTQNLLLVLCYQKFSSPSYRRFKGSCCMKHACNSSIRQHALSPCRRSCRTVAARLERALSDFPTQC